jgi:mannose-1-phosphate guanylyltransferase/phosphomannomutase
MYGFIAEGYWCDVGNIAEYMRATNDVLSGLVQLGSLGKVLAPGIYVNEDVEIAPDAQIYGPVYLGLGVKIKGGAIIHGPTVIRDYTVIDNHAHVERSIIWRNCYVGEGAELRGAIVGRQCSLKSKVVCFEGSVIGDSSVIGEASVIHPNVKIWPNKEVEAGATIKTSIIWGSQGRRVLFGRYGVTGLVNVDLTPEFAAQLGAAFAATLPQGSTVTINRDPHRSSRMLKRAAIAGLPSAGVDVLDTQEVPIPVIRYYTRNSDAAGGLHLRLSPYDSRVVDIRFFDAKGQDLSTDAARNIERVFFREDFRRVYLDQIGVFDYASRVREQYSEAFLRAVNAEAIRTANPYIVVDFANAPTAEILSPLLAKLRCRVVALNAAIDESKMSIPSSEFQDSLRQLAKICGVLEAALGVRLDVGGERIFVVDDQGNTVPGITLAAALAVMTLKARGGGTVAVPVSMPDVFESLAAAHQGQVLRTKLNPQALMQAANRPEVVMAADGNGSFIFPELHPVVDGMFAVAKLLEYLTTQKAALSQAVKAVPAYFLAQEQVACPWEQKGTVMRLLNQQFKERLGKQIDGCRIELGREEWVLVLPDADRPVFHIYAQARSNSEAKDLASRYVRIVESLQE